ncbi:hypothetical protein MA5S0422_4580 [Mycobacteroides abscessus 5S-0422]|uniref:Uncharacterized protein n=1 Tax=Mycobacteroides abscessus subsp. bolletii 1513 TaxID=1299321 RepID=X8DJX7_9MYCO|nr:hypothetical protein MA5S0422_4580 [Mycobacteroides abscessus 5S-0422]EIU21981.1 hypothetical protein MA5S0708_3334 [Mycobacteroides abscessus 5S-0708]EUA67760.1 hypothetical protein I540_4714 [Mycobacteroides abscessus subsp. bolletii 1513]
MKPFGLLDLGFRAAWVVLTWRAQPDARQVRVHQAMVAAADFGV